MTTGTLPSTQNRFVVVYTITLLLCFSPFKSLSLISPLIAVFLMIFFVRVRSVYNLSKLFIFFFLYAVLGIIYYLVNEDFLWLNFFFFLFTNASFFFLLVSYSSIVNSSLINRLAKATLTVLVFEAVYGLVQVLYNGFFITHSFDGGTGDSAMGTINPSFGTGDGSASNAYFAIGLSAMLVLVVATTRYMKSKEKFVRLSIIVVTWIMASVMHSILLLLSAIFMTAVLLVFFMPKRKLSFFKKQLSALRSILSTSFVIAVLLIMILPGNIELLKNYYEQTFVEEKMTSSKSIATLATVKYLYKDKPYQRYIGLGPGQYTSRASLILSDEYLNSKLPLFLKSVSPDLERHILPIWFNYKSSFQAGSTYFPFYSWLSLYGEFGIMGWSILFILMFLLCKRLLSIVNLDNFYLVLGLLIIALYLFLLGVQDNYWEWGQFMLPIIIFAKTIYYMCTKTEES